jgi:integrase
MNKLPNDCYCSPLKVHPKNWSTTKASLKINWYIYYRFYTPQINDAQISNKGKLVLIKRMNKFLSLQERQTETRNILETEMASLKDGSHSIYGKIVQPSPTEQIQTTTPFLTALKKVAEQLKVSSLTKRDFRTILNFVTKASNHLRFSELPISTISRRHIKLTLAQIEVDQQKESPHRYNKVRSYLMILFKELVELEVLETNPLREISRKQSIHPLRQLLSLQERSQIDNHLRQHHYRFWLFTHIFFHSGTRLTEIIQLKRHDVDLNQQLFVVTVQKGKQYKQVIKPIKDVALPYWLEATKDASEEDYLFSKGLQPGSLLINSNQVTRRWNKHVKKRLGIKQDFYSLKHLNLDETALMLNLEDAAAMASHTSTSITLKHYAVGEKHRQNERLKKVNNTFAK